MGDALQLIVDQVLQPGTYSFHPTPVPSGPPGTGVFNFIGFNIDSVSSQSPAPILYADVMKMSRKWGSWSHPEDQAAPTDCFGWPTSNTGGVVVFADRDNADGVYQVSYRGQSKLVLLNSGSSSMVLTYTAATDTTQGRINVVGKNLWFRYTGGPPIDLQVIAPGAVKGSKWHPVPLKFLKLGGGLRFMDLMATNGSPIVHWSDRTEPGCATANLKTGMPYEDLIDLQNTLRLPAWYCIPHAADDNFVQNLGGMLAALVNPDLPVYIQYGNELWNSDGIFNIAYTYNRQAAINEVAKGDNTLSANGTDTNTGYWMWKREAKRLCQIRNLFPQQPDILSRFRFIVESQHKDSDKEPGFQAKMQLEYIRDYFGPPAKWIYAIASAPYGSAGHEYAVDPALTIDKYIDALQKNAVGASIDPPMLARVKLAMEYNIRYVGYETNPVGDYGFANTGVYLAAQSDPRMRDIVRKYYQNWFNAGGNEVFHFVAWSWWKTYVWGAASNAAQLDAPKLLGITDVTSTL